MKRFIFERLVGITDFKHNYLKIFLLFLGLLILTDKTFAQVDSIKNEIRKEDTTKIVIGEKEIQIIDGPAKNDTEVHIKDKKNNETNKNENKRGWHSGGFKGHWSGLEIGLNNYLNKDYGMSLSGSDEFMSLNTNRSINVSLNFAQHSFGIIGNRFGLVTGLGVEFYNYFFEHNNTIEKNEDGFIVSKSYDPIDLDKSKLTLTYLTVPLLFEFQFPGQLKNSKRIRMSVGIIGGLKLGSHTKVVYYEHGDKKKDKNHDDFNLNSLRYGLTARVGYKHINIYADYYPVALFENNKGPVLYPISVGIAFVSNK